MARTGPDLCCLAVCYGFLLALARSVRRLRVVPFVVTYSFAAQGASALGLGDYVGAVVVSDPQVREEVHRYRQVLQDHEIALSGWRPSLDLTLSVGAASRQASGTNQRRREFDSSEANVILSQNLFSGFDTTNEIDQARSRITSAAYRLYDTADNIALDAVSAYVNVLEERRLQELAAQNVESHERVLAQIKVLSDEGLIRRSDLKQTQGRLARAQAGLIAQQNNLTDAVTQMHKLLGRYVAPDVVEELELLQPEADAIAGLIGRALQAHPALESARNNILSALAAYERSRSSDYPRVDLELRQQLGNDIDGPNGRTEDSRVMLNFSYNLFRGGADQAEQRKSASEVQVQKAFHARVQRQVIDTLRLAWAADKALEGQLPFLIRHSDKSLETVELYRDEFLVQKRDLIDLLDAENELNQALTAEAQAHYEHLLAGYRIQEGMGGLFSTLRLGVEIGDQSISLASLDAAGIDTPEVATDSDADGTSDSTDQCDNSVVITRASGCAEQVVVPLGYAAVAQVFVAGDDTFRSLRNETLVIQLDQLLENDSAGPRDAPTIRSVSSAEHGAVELGDERHVFYDPPKDFLGTDTFTYTIGDRRARNATARVTIEVVSSLAPLPASAIVYFASNSLALVEESGQRLDELAGQLRGYPRVRIEVRAYTDARGSSAYNLRLSKRRAESIERLLVGHGIDAARIEARGMGEESQDADNADATVQQRGRRAELRFIIANDS